MITKIQVERQAIPDSLLACEIPPVGAFVTNGDAQAYVAELHRQARACADKVESVREIVRP